MSVNKQIAIDDEFVKSLKFVDLKYQYKELLLIILCVVYIIIGYPSLMPYVFPGLGIRTTVYYFTSSIFYALASAYLEVATDIFLAWQFRSYLSKVYEENYFLINTGLEGYSFDNLIKFGKLVSWSSYRFFSKMQMFSLLIIALIPTYLLAKKFYKTDVIFKLFSDCDGIDGADLGFNAFLLGNALIFLTIKVFAQKRLWRYRVKQYMTKYNKASKIENKNIIKRL